MLKLKKQFKGAVICSNVRFTDELYDKLKQVAREYGMSFNSLVLQCCNYALEYRMECMYIECANNNWGHCSLDEIHINSAGCCAEKRIERTVD